EPDVHARLPSDLWPGPRVWLPARPHRRGVRSGRHPDVLPHGGETALRIAHQGETRVMIRATVSLLALATFTGRSVTGQVATAPAALREALLNRDRATSEAVRRDGLARGLAPAFDSEPLLLLEGAALVADRAAAVRLLEQRAELAALRVQWLPLAVLVSLDGTLGVTYGMTAITGVPVGDTTRLRFGKYISVWRRRDGAWYLAAHLQTGLLPRDAPVTGAAPSPAPAAAQPTGPGARFAAADRAFARMAADSGAPAAFA